MYKRVCLILIVILFQLVPGNIFAQESQSCTTCYGPPPALEEYNSMVLDILQAIETYDTDGRQAGVNTTPGLFQNNALPVNQSNIAEKGLAQLAKNISQSVQTTAAIAGILTKSVTSFVTSDIIPGLGLVRSNETVQRDMDMLANIDEIINEKRLQLGLGGGLWETVDTEHFQTFQNIKESYQNTLLFDDEGGGLRVGTTASYGEVLTLLEKVQKRMKRLIVFGGAQNFMTVEGKPKIIGTKATGIQFEPDVIRSIIDGYSCVRGIINQCNSDAQAFGKIIGEKAQEGAKDIATSIQRFGTSAKKLGAAFRNAQILRKDTTLLEQECNRGDTASCQALMALGEAGVSTNGLTANSKAPRIRAVIAGQQEAGIDNMLQGISQAYQDIASFSKQYNYYQQTRADQGTQEAGEQLGSFIMAESLEVAIARGLQDTLNSYRQSQQHAIISNPRSLTQSIPILCSNIQLTLDTIGNKDAQQSIIQNLGIACEKQCANVGGTCRY